MQEQSMQAVAEQIMALRDVEVAEFIRSEVSQKRLSSKLHLLNDGTRSGSPDSRALARQAIERLGFL